MVVTLASPALTAEAHALMDDIERLRAGLEWLEAGGMARGAAAAYLLAALEQMVADLASHLPTQYR